MWLEPSGHAVCRDRAKYREWLKMGMLGCTRSKYSWSLVTSGCQHTRPQVHARTHWPGNDIQICAHQVVDERTPRRRRRRGREFEGGEAEGDRGRRRDRGRLDAHVAVPGWLRLAWRRERGGGRRFRRRGCCCCCDGSVRGDWRPGIAGDYGQAVLAMIDAQAAFQCHWPGRPSSVIT